MELIVVLGHSIRYTLCMGTLYCQCLGRHHFAHHYRTYWMTPYSISWPNSSATTPVWCVTSAVLLVNRDTVNLLLLQGLQPGSMLHISVKLVMKAILSYLFMHINLSRLCWAFYWNSEVCCFKVSGNVGFN